MHQHSIMKQLPLLIYICLPMQLLRCHGHSYLGLHAAHCCKCGLLYPPVLACSHRPRLVEKIYLPVSPKIDTIPHNMPCASAPPAGAPWNREATCYLLCVGCLLCLHAVPLRDECHMLQECPVSCSPVFVEAPATSHRSLPYQSCPCWPCCC